MSIGTHVYNTLRTVSPDKLRYDQNAKEFLADVQIMARIMQYTVKEVMDLSVEEIIACIDKESIEIGKTPVEPGMTNLGKIQGASTENIILNEGTVYFDIRCTLNIEQVSLKVIINVEAQKSTSNDKLGYHIESRMVYYLSRLISSQKEVEFFHSDYDSIKKAYSIWICMDAEDDRDSITQISLAEKSLYGEIQNFEHLDKMCGIIVHIRKNSNVQESKNKLIAMLEDAFSTEDVEKKKGKLQEKYGIKMTLELEGRVNDMCNLSDAVEERGMERGMAQGEKDTSIKIAKNLYKKGMTLEEIKTVVEILTEDELREIYQQQNY